jgi:hypothetical protein
VEAKLSECIGSSEIHYDSQSCLHGLSGMYSRIVGTSHGRLSSSHRLLTVTAQQRIRWIRIFTDRTFNLSVLLLQRLHQCSGHRCHWCCGKYRPAWRSAPSHSVRFQGNEHHCRAALSQPFRYPAVVRTCSSPALAEAIRSVPALCSCSLRRARAILRSLHDRSLAVPISASIVAIDFALIRRGLAYCRVLTRLRRRLRLGKYWLGREEKRYEKSEGEYS